MDRHVSRHVEVCMRLDRHVVHEVARGGLQVALERTCKTLERPQSSSIRGQPFYGLSTPFLILVCDPPSLKYIGLVFLLSIGYGPTHVSCY